MPDEYKPIIDAPEKIKRIILSVIEHEKSNMTKRRGIKEDIVEIIKKEIK